MIPRYYDRRIFERLRAQLSVRLQEPPDESGGQVQLKDISAQGARISLRQPLSQQDIVSFLVQLPDGFAPLILKGHVMWSQHEPGQNAGWEIGVKFHDINFMDMHRVIKFCNSLANQPNP